MTDRKKSGHPSQPGNRSTAPLPFYEIRKRGNIVYRARRFFKRLHWGKVTALLVVLLLAVYGAFSLLSGALSKNEEPAADPVETQETQSTPEVPEYIFRDGDGTPVDMQAMTGAWAAEAGMEKRYDLTDAERWEVASVVTAEAAGEPFAGKVAVAQCILQAAEDKGIRPDEVVASGYAPTRPDPTEEALEAVQAVFDFGHVATTEPIKYFYAPALVYSEWHETQVYVLTINGHKFFKEAK